MYSTVKTLESSDHRERVLISRRPDGNYTYRRQWLSAALPNDDPDSPIVDARQEREMAWGPLGPDIGDARANKYQTVQRFEWTDGAGLQSVVGCS